jgi:hypothetical protein
MSTIGDGLPSRKVQSTRLVRPSAFFWSRFQLVCAVAFAVCLLLSFVVLVAFHSGLLAIGLGALALASQTGNMWGLVQRGRELQRGYTTIPWLAGEVELRDPADGRVLVPRRYGGAPFRTMSLARAFAGEPQGIAEASGAHVMEEASVPSGEPPTIPEQTVRVPGGRPPIAALVVSALLVLAVVGAFVVTASSSGGARVVGVTGGVLASLTLVLAALSSVGRVASGRRKRQLDALAMYPLVIACRRTVEMFGEVSRSELASLRAQMALTVGRERVELWAGRRALRTTWSTLIADIHRVSRATAHDTRGNEKPAICIEYGTNQRLLLFPEQAGRRAMFYASEATTDSVVAEIVTVIAHQRTAEGRSN